MPRGQTSSHFVSGPEGLRRFAERQSWTCAIDNGFGEFGTGVLIGPDLVLTSFHVVEKTVANGDASLARCRFDFHDDPDTGEVNPGRWVGFLAGRWLVESSRYSDADRLGARTGFRADELDYAVIRLAEEVGMQPPGEANGEQGDARGWAALPHEPRLPADGAPINVFQHPAEYRNRLGRVPGPMAVQWAPGTIIEHLDGDLRMRHGAPGGRGSSGAPCYDSSFRELVAIHHAGDRTLGIDGFGEWKQAIPMVAIVRHLRARGQAHLIGRHPPPRRPAGIAISANAQSLRDEAIGRRIWAASILMDRDAEEQKVERVRQDSGGNRGMVHVLACRDVDRHDSFIKRLSVAAAGERAEAQRRRLAFLDGSDDACWRVEHVEWHVDEPEGWALEAIAQRLREIAALQGRAIALSAVPIARVKHRREHRVVHELARLCPAIADADRLQLFIVYYDVAEGSGTGAHPQLRRQLAGLWSLDRRPPGGGVCAMLEDVDSNHLASWRALLQSAWGVDEFRIGAVVDGVFAGRRSMPIKDAESSLAPGLRQLLAR